ncbi:MAG: methyltransferase domain-containing protein [Butyrivibrio sp.]|nr:methyltransferase domain-containing protein [Butyrivibrio sp.]
MLKKIESGMFRLGLLSDDYIMRRNLIDSVDMKYEKVKEYWNDENQTVHGDTSAKVMEGYAYHIAQGLALGKEDVLLSVGCGDGHVDSYLQDKVAALYGFDFAETKVKAAKKRNPRGNYWTQSFLDEYACPPE